MVWLKDAVNEKACGMAILGDLKPAPGGTWGGGWIYDPDREQRFDVVREHMANNSLNFVVRAVQFIFRRIGFNWICLCMRRC